MFELGTPTPRVRGLENGVPGSMQPKMCSGLPGFGCCSGLRLYRGLEFAAGVENAPGKAGYPCWFPYSSIELESYRLLFVEYLVFYSPFKTRISLVKISLIALRRIVASS